MAGNLKTQVRGFADLGGGYGWRLYEVHHGQGERRDGLVEAADQSDGVQLVGWYPEEHGGEGGGGVD